MRPMHPHFNAVGVGPGVVCAHSDADTSPQWRALAERLAPRYRVFAPDSCGAGRTRPLALERPLTLHDEVALLEPVFGAAGAPFFLVGHSYGAAVALVAALARPERVRALVLVEPALFALPEQPAWGGRRAARALELPVLILLGAQSPPSSHAIARLLAETLANVTLIEFESLGHMGSAPHPDLVNESVADFLACH